MNFRWFIVSWAGRSGECCHICIIWMTSFGRFSSNPWILLAELDLTSLVHLSSTLLKALWTMKKLLSIDENSSPSQKRLSLSLKRLPHIYREATMEIWPSDKWRRLPCAAKGVIPLNTKSLNNWALCNLHNLMESVCMITLRKVTAFSTMASRYHLRPVASSWFTKPPEARTVSAPKISNLIQPIGFKD